ncbi:unnamed protein product [Discosporangium mesarthrocarpum]
MRTFVAMTVGVTAALTRPAESFVQSALPTFTGGSGALPGNSGNLKRAFPSSSSRSCQMAADESSASRLVLQDSDRRKSNMAPDAAFYDRPRICFHVDQGFMDQLTQLYRERIPAGGVVLDIMSSWVSHLPPEVSYARVDGHGMNMEELNKNRRLDSKKVNDLNAVPRLPFEADMYDAVTCAVSVQYLQRPEAVFTDVQRVLKPGGVAIFSFSNRMFPDKAIAAWKERSDYARLQLVSEYFYAAGGFEQPEIIQRRSRGPSGFLGGVGVALGLVGPGDPFLAVVAQKRANP